MSVCNRPQLDWASVRDTLDLAEVATHLLGPAPGRRGERGRRLWWPCPFHEDRNPSLTLTPDGGHWHCFGCGESGDAAAMVMRLEGVTFPEAVAYLTGAPAPWGKAATRPAKRPVTARPAEPSGTPEADA